MLFWNSLAFLMIQQILAIWSLVPLPFLKPAWPSGIYGSHIAEAWLGEFEHYFSSMWNECNCVVGWAFFGTAFLWDLNENWPLTCGHCWVFQICWHIECSTFKASSFRIWNSSTGIPSPSLALFIVMLSKAHLTSHSRMSGSRWVITPLWISWNCFLGCLKLEGKKILIKIVD